jgi:hypothetical protein
LTPITEVVEALLKNLSDRIALAILLLSAVCLILMLIPGRVGVWMVDHWVWILLGLLGSLCYLPTRIVLEKASEWASERKRRERLRHLTAGEKDLLRIYIIEDIRSKKILRADAVAAGLADDGILYCPKVTSEETYFRSYNIQDWARLYLKKHFELIAELSKA